MMTTIRASQPDRQACAIARRLRGEFPWLPDLARFRPWPRLLWPCDDIHIPEAPWWVVEAVDKKRARLNCINHLLTQFPYQEIQRDAVVLPPRVRNPDYYRGPVPKEMYVPAIY